jgi:hypothetical protein
MEACVFLGALCMSLYLQISDVSLRLYVGFQSPSIIRYLSRQTGYLFNAHMPMCKLGEQTFPKLGEPTLGGRLTLNNWKLRGLHNDAYNGQGGRMSDAFSIYKASVRMLQRSVLNDTASYPASIVLDFTPTSTTIQFHQETRGGQEV